MTTGSGAPFFNAPHVKKISIMLHKNKEAMSLTVTEGLSVTILPNPDHEFLMTTKEVANGYGTSDYVIRRSKLDHSHELIEGKHFVTAVSFSHGEMQSTLKTLKIPHNSVLWTKRGIVRLGFFIKSKQAKLFRDWAEELIIRVEEQRDLFGMAIGADNTSLHLPAKRKHNRLTQARLVSILADVCRIDDKELRLSLTNKLMEGGEL